MSHIALFLPDMHVGGAERVFLTLAQDFARKGHKVDLVLAHAEGMLLNLIPAGVRVVDLKAARWQPMLALSAIHGMIAYLKRERPDVCMSTLTGANLVAVMSHRLARSSARLVLREACTLQNVRSNLRRRVMRWLYPYADAVIALNHVISREMEQLIGVPPERLHILANPIHLEEVLQQSQVPIEYPWQGEELPIVLGIGRLVPQKDFATLIRAFSVVRGQMSARLLILGDGSKRNELEDLVRELGLQDCVSLPGADTNPYRWLRNARVFVLSSRWEGYPNVVLEALALGVPIVATSYDASIGDLLGRNEAVILTPVGDVAALAEAIMKQITTRHHAPPSLPQATLKASEGYLQILTEMRESTATRP